jgi:AraC family transcriptional regulator of adaptative response/methylated-DNA-[protein]-cysteine methyltransferase
MLTLEQQCQNYLDVIKLLNGLQPAAVGCKESKLKQAIANWSGCQEADYLKQLKQRHLKENRPIFQSGRRKIELKSFPDKLIRSQGEGLMFHYSSTPTPYGYAFLVQTQYGLYQLSYGTPTDIKKIKQKLIQDWPQAKIREDKNATAFCAEKIFTSQKPVKIFVKATNFQQDVWQKLLEIPAGQLCRYTDIAKAIERPKACRAVGTAVGGNPIAWLIPCHRVIPATGKVGNYRWGATIKQMMILKESCATG